MHTKNLVAYNYNINLGKKIIRKIISMKKLFLPLLLIICFISIIPFNKILEGFNNKDILVADFKTDINMLSETAGVLEMKRTSNKSLQINKFGADGKLIDASEITPDLSAALIKLADINNDGEISNEEVWTLGIMRLKPDIFEKELRELQFNLRSADHNLKKFIIITKGEHRGTILYNGPLKFIDNENKRYFGLDLFD